MTAVKIELRKNKFTVSGMIDFFKYRINENNPF